MLKGSWLSHKCPKCGHPQYCGCKACLVNFPPPVKPYKWDKDKKDHIVCGGCGLSLHGCDWMDEEYEFMETLKLNNIVWC